MTPAAVAVADVAVLVIAVRPVAMPERSTTDVKPAPAPEILIVVKAVLPVITAATVEVPPMFSVVALAAVTTRPVAAAVVLTFTVVALAVVNVPNT